MMKRSFAKINRRSEKMIYLVVGAAEDAERIPVYNQLLQNTSPVFKRLIESMKPDNNDLEILGISKKIMSILIEYIYQTFEDGEASLPITEENVSEFCFAANKFELADVQCLCHKYLDTIEVTKENCIQLFKKSFGLTSANFKTKCLDVLLPSLAQLVTTRAFVNLTLAPFMLIIREGRATGKCSEDVLCEATTNWLHRRSREISKDVQDLIKEFPRKRHKSRIVQDLFEIPNPEVQKFSFNLLLELYKKEPKIITNVPGTKASHHNSLSAPAKTGQNNCKQYKSHHPMAHGNPLKRHSEPLPHQQLHHLRLDSCPQPKKTKTPDHPIVHAETAAFAKSLSEFHASVVASKQHGGGHPPLDLTKSWHGLTHDPSVTIKPVDTVNAK